MATLPKQIISVATLVVACCVQGVAFCRADDLQVAIHALVKPYVSTEGARWEADKKTLAGYNPEQLVRALIAEIDLDRGSPNQNFERDVIVYDLFRALDLPPTLLCQELDKPSSPDRKASLISVLRHANKPEVVQALLRQLGDRRTVTMRRMDDMDDGVKPRPFRVRDEAFNSLIANVDAPHDLRRLRVYDGDKFKDEMIQEGLAKLGLTPP